MEEPQKIQIPYDPDGVLTTTGGYTYRNVYNQGLGLNLSIMDLHSENARLKGMLKSLAEHLLIEKAGKNGLDVITVTKLLYSDSPGDRQIAISLVNDKILSDILNSV